MDIAQLEGRFQGVVELARVEFQRSLTQFFVEHPASCEVFLDAVGVRRAARGRELIPDREFWTPAGDRLEFLVETATRTGIFDRNAGPWLPNVWPRTGSAIPAALSTLFGMWVFFFDRARGTYYYPFARRNLVFCRVAPNGPAISTPREDYKDAMESLLAGYSLTIGQGSVGLAQRLKSEAVVEDTLSDPRGAVALEDLFLRNFSYMGFGIHPGGSRASIKEDVGGGRFRGQSFAHAGLLFPAPCIARDQETCARLHSFLTASGCLQSVSRILEPLVCHIEDFQLLRALNRISRTMTRLSKSEGDVRAGFAEALCRQSDDASAVQGDTRIVSGLRDPFAIGAMHIIERSNPQIARTGSDYEVRRFWFGERSFGPALRVQVEDDEFRLDRSVQAPWKRLRSTLQKHVGVIGLSIDALPDDRDLDIDEREEVLCGVLGSNPSRAEVVAFLTEFPSRMAKVHQIVAENNDALLNWVSPKFHEMDEGGMGEWLSFNTKVRQQKIWEAVVATIGAAIAHELLDPPERRPWKAAGALLKLLPRTEGAGRLVSEVESILAGASKLPVDNGRCLVFTGLLNPVGLTRVATVLPEGARSSAIKEELGNPHTLRPMMLAALCGNEFPGSSGAWRKVRVANSASQTLLRSGFGNDIERGVGVPYNYGLGTCFSHVKGWRRLTQGLAGEPPEWLYWIKIHQQTILLLGPNIDSRSLNRYCESAAAQSDPFETLQTLLTASENRAVILTGWSPARRDWTFPVWQTDVGAIARTVESHTTLARRAAPVASTTDIDSLIVMLNHCQRLAFSEGQPLCFPQRMLEPISASEASLQVPTTLTPSFKQTACVCEDGRFIVGRSAETLSAEAAVAVDSLLSHSALPELFRREWGWRWNVLWPIVVPSDDFDERPRGFIVFSLQLPKFAEAEHGVDGLHQELFNEAVDYLEFSIGQSLARDRLVRHLQNFSHSLKGPLRVAGGPVVRAATNAALFVQAMNRRGVDESVLSTKPRLARVRHVAAAVELWKLAGADGERLYNTVDKLVTDRVNIVRRQFCAKAIVDALTLTLAGSPERPMNTLDHSDGVVPFNAASDWIQFVIERWLKTLDGSVKGAVKDGLDQSSLSSLARYPGGSVEVVLDEVFRNLDKYADVTEECTFSCGLTKGYLEIVVSNGRQNSGARRSGTGQGLGTIGQIVYANTGVRSAVEHHIDNKRFRMTVRFDLSEYDRRVVQFHG